ncbi:MAG TPA: hypothetical protein DIS66_00510 [Candidatus Omnitrophica bacterium]|nr:hypothetical protein [Candidatus Omnitrophota bacterium]
MSTDQYRKKICRYCDSPLGKSFLDLGANHPLANSLPRKEDLNTPQFVCPLELVKCGHCHLVQLAHAVPADLMFKDYLYVSSTTKTFREHFAAYAQTVKSKLTHISDPVAVDIGSNDGLLVSCYMKEGMKAVGVDPAENLAKQANAEGRPTLNRYFDAVCVKEIISKYGKAHAISANNVFAHIDDIQSVCRNVFDLLDDQGFFVIEFPYLVTMLDEMLFDMIYHEHVSYIGVTSLQFLMQKFGGRVFDIQQVSSHGGSLRVFICKQAASYQAQPIVAQLLKLEKDKGCLENAVYEKFAARVLNFKKDLNTLLSGLRSEGKTICGYGAPAKATTIVNFCELTPKQIDYIVDDNPLKQGRFVPGGQCPSASAPNGATGCIPIVPSSHLESKPADYILIFAWNFAKEIMSKLPHLQDRGVQFIVPLPEPHVILDHARKS